jgi:cellulose synthase/poly-beta-1,6-N-acetylglucosamine synthase-like glycosyltransferase
MEVTGPSREPIAYNEDGPVYGGCALFTALGDRLNLSAGLFSHVPQHPVAYFAFAQQNSLRHYLKMQYADQTFQGLYHWNWFDLALLIPYFAVMIVLSVYGIHRYTLCYLYHKYRKNYDPNPKGHFDALPRVTVQLPIFNEQFVIDRLIESVCAMEYPREKLEIQVLDDSTDETTAVASAIVERYAALGYPIVYIHRTNRYGFKAGALDAGLKVGKGEFVAIFDADFVPPPDWLMNVIHHFTDPEIGMVQTRWTHLNREYSMLTRIEAILLDGHFILEHGARSRTGDFFNFNGTAGMWRRKAIFDGGGWQHDTLTEDTDLSYRSQMAGWKFKYLPEIECPSELPIEMTAFKTQQARWAKGLIQTSIKLLPVIFRSNVSRRIKIEAVYHLTANMSYPLMVIMSALLMPAMICRFYQGWFQMLLIDVPLFAASSFSIAVFYVASQRVLFPKNWMRTFLYLPFSPSPTPKQSWKPCSESRADSCARQNIEWPGRAKNHRPRNTASASFWHPGSNCSSAHISSWQFSIPSPTTTTSLRHF